MLSKKAIFPVVATALLLVVAVVAVIGFQNWFGMYSSNTFVKVERDSKGTSNTQIEALVGNQLYFKNSLDENISIKQIKVGDRECDIALIVEPGIYNISLGNCTDDLNSNVNDVVVITSDEVYEKKILFKEVEILPIPVIEYFLDANYVSAPEGNYYNTPWILINITANESIQSCSLNFNGTINSGFTIQNDSCFVNQTLNDYGVYNYNVTVVGNNSGVNLTSTKILNYQVQCVSGSQVFSHTGDYQTFDVPLGCTNFTVKMWGAGGGGAPHNYGDTRTGGAGGFTIANITINDTISNFSIIVGGRGEVIADWTSCSGVQGGFGGGGNSGSHDYSNGLCSGSGGGRSAIRIDNVEMVTAGGGGGNGNWAGNGGPGGGLLGGNGNGAWIQIGSGGTQVAGGAPGLGGGAGLPATGGTQFQGGKGGDYDTSSSGASSGGGGGGGYYGGGGGAQDSNAGGGSGYCGGSVVTSCTTIAGSTRIPPQTGDVDYQAGIGYGGIHEQNGGHGLVVISWS